MTQLHEYHELAFVVDSATDRLPEPDRTAFREGVIRLGLIKYLMAWERHAETLGRYGANVAPIRVFIPAQVREQLRERYPNTEDVHIAICDISGEYGQISRYIEEEYDSLFTD